MRSAAVLVLAVLAACGTGPSDRASGPRPRTPGVRMTMAALHQVGGVPPGWKLTPPAGDVAEGRTAFDDFGCPSCHRVEGESFSAKPSAGQVGPELTGMGAHHPPAYFAEAIMSPDAVLIEGPGYIGPDGHSVMPDYPEMTLRQLGDIVAYLSSLKSGGPHAGHVMPAPESLVPSNVIARPKPPELPAKAFYVMSYDVKPDQLGAFEAWWQKEGARRFLAFDGMIGVDTYVDFTRTQNHYTSLFGFRDGAALQAFTQDPAGSALGLEFDGFIGEHSHAMQLWPAIYRVATLSTP